MENICIQPCTLNGFAHLLPIIETQAEVFDYATKRHIIQQATKAIEQSPDNPLVLLALHESVTIGFIGFQLDSENPTISELFGHVVKRGYQGRGIGSQLLATGITHLKQTGADKILLRLKASTPSYVSRFYKKAGFKPVFNETYTGASDEEHTLILSFHQATDDTPSIYPA